MYVAESPINNFANLPSADRAEVDVHIGVRSTATAVQKVADMRHMRRDVPVLVDQAGGLVDPVGQAVHDADPLEVLAVVE